MKLLALIGALMVFMACAAVANAGCVTGGSSGGLSWGSYFYPQIPTAGNIFGATLIVNGYGTTGSCPTTCNHTIGRLGFQNGSSGTTPAIQEGIWAEGGAAARFYVEVQGVPKPTTGGTWETRMCGSVTCYEHFWTVSTDPKVGSSYNFSLKNLGSGNYEGIGPSYTSPSMPLGTISNPTSTVVNESYYSFNDSSCNTWGDYEFFNFIPASYGTNMQHDYFESGDNQFFTTTWTNPDGVVYISIDGS